MAAAHILAARRLVAERAITEHVNELARLAGVDLPPPIPWQPDEVHRATETEVRNEAILRMIRERFTEAEKAPAKRRDAERIKRALITEPSE